MTLWHITKESVHSLTWGGALHYSDIRVEMKSHKCRDVQRRAGPMRMREAGARSMTHLGLLIM